MAICYVPKPGYMWNPLENFPRNLPCFCGSEVKFKKCHMPGLSRTISVEQYKKLEPYIPAIYSGKLRITKGQQNETSIDNNSPEPKHGGTLVVADSLYEPKHEGTLVVAEKIPPGEPGSQPEPVIVTPAK